MRARHKMKMALFCLLLLSAVAGCGTAELPHRAMNGAAAQSQAADGLALHPGRFTSLNDLWRTEVQPFEESASLQPFEKDGMSIAVCVRPGNEIGVNVVRIYAYDETGKQWRERVYWDTGARGYNEVLGVNMVFDQPAEILEARSAGGTLIFRASLTALAAKQPAELFSRTRDAHYPAFRKWEELKASAESEGRLSVYEDGRDKIAIREQSWGTASWRRLIIYTLDGGLNLWRPRAVWDVGTGEVHVTFDRTGGIVTVRSGGALVFQTSITALKARQAVWGW